MENHEFAAVLFEKRLDEFCSKSRKTVSVGDHDRELISLVYSFQYGEKPFAFEVESCADVISTLIAYGSDIVNASLAAPG